MFKIGDFFSGDYPPEAAEWCNDNGAVMVLVEGGFQIQALPAPTAEQLYANLRAARDLRLAATDKYMLADYPISADSLAVVKTYRMALRNLTEQTGAPWDGGGAATPWPSFPPL